jgi:hypothetical protein
MLFPNPLWQRADKMGEKVLRFTVEQTKIWSMGHLLPWSVDPFVVNDNFFVLTSKVLVLLWANSTTLPSTVECSIYAYVHYDDDGFWFMGYEELHDPFWDSCHVLYMCVSFESFLGKREMLHVL